MKIKNIAAIYAILIGTSIIGIWTMLYITGSIPEFKTEPIRIVMHLLAEIATQQILECGNRLTIRLAGSIIEGFSKPLD